MKKNTDIVGMIGLLLAIFTLVFGDNIYQQITGHSIFQNSSSEVAKIPSDVATSVATSFPSGSRPSSYTLQVGEHLNCIGRRFDIDPDELIRLNGFTDGSTLYPGLVIKIPQTGKTFPGERAFHEHPDTYTVSSSNETVYEVACYYGDVDPAIIAFTNGISVGTTLTVGKVLTIP